MKEANSTETKYQMFEKIMAGGLAIFSAVAIIQLAGAGELIGPLLFALCCLSIALPFLIFQIACIILEVPQRHRVLIQTSTMVIALVGMFGLLISVSSLIGILFAISCICAYYLFTIFSADAKPSEDSTQTELAASSVKAVITTGST
ncbi:MAG: hypothetical protein U9Q07_09305, partial [Planctomycetota bacterium]|nr:hypothetical protein [Planctomycetota bacterium]